MLGKVLLITGGEVNLEFVRKYIDSISYDTVICADSGLNTAYRLKLPVHYFMGDFDSVTPQILESYRNGTVAGSEACEWVRYPKEKDYTDTHIAIINALKAGASVIYILGATGTRMDHTFTNICNMKAALDSGVPCFICDSHNKIYLINDKMGEVKVSKTGQYGDYVSFVPLSEETIISLAGFKYVLDDYILHQGLSICQSNEIKENVAVINIKKGLVIVFETKD